MTAREFLNNASNSNRDIIQLFLDLLHNNNFGSCVIGDLAVNAYVEPVVSLDLDIVVAAASVDQLAIAAEDFFTSKRFENSINLTSAGSEIRIQLQTDNRYQDFIGNASTMKVMGYEMMVAALPDVLQGKIWAYTDKQRRQSKRQKDLADIMRIVESFPELHKLLPDSIQRMF